jgi:DNA-binding SARP family transcriptional activator
MQVAEKSWQFYLLGGLQVFHAGERISSPVQRANELLAFLLLNPRPQPRIYVAGQLAPDIPESSALKRLSDHLWLLRRALPEIHIEISRERLFLPPEHRWLDSEAFLEAGQCEDMAAWQAALQLYQGELLPGFYAEWLVVERERLYIHWLHMINKITDAYMQGQDYREALPWLQRLVQAEPLDETALRKLMSASSALGQRGEALSAYERFVHLASQELKIEPDPLTQRLADGLYHADITPIMPSPRRIPAQSPQVLLEDGRQALERGDRRGLEGCLQALKSQPGTDDRLEAQLLEVDAHLSFGEIPPAETILKSMDSSLIQVKLRLARLALKQEDLEQTRKMASETLLSAHESEDVLVELDALLILAQVQRRTGEMLPALVSVDKALQLSRNLGTHDRLIGAMSERAWVFTRQGRYSEALSLFQGARSLAESESLQLHLAEVLTNLGTIQSYHGDFIAAHQNSLKALSLWRDLGLPRKEATTLQRLALICNQIGENDQALVYLERAQNILEALHDQAGNARNRYNLAAAMPYSDETLVGRSIDLAHAALDAFRELGQPGWEASCLALLGYNLWVSGDCMQALPYLEEAYRLHEKLGEMAVLAELLSYQALALVGLGRYKAAMGASQAALLALAQGALDNDIVSEIYYAHAVVLEALENPSGAQDYYRKAYQNLLKYAEQFNEEAARRAFFRRDPTVRRLMDKVYSLGIAPPPDHGVVQAWAMTPTGRRIRASWTLDAGPPDVALRQSQGAIALRRLRLGRILRESTAQKVVVSQEQLAELLGVSPRTIKRDLAIIRKPEKS